MSLKKRKKTPTIKMSIDRIQKTINEAESEIKKLKEIVDKAIPD